MVILYVILAIILILAAVLLLNAALATAKPRKQRERRKHIYRA